MRICTLLLATLLSLPVSLAAQAIVRFDQGRRQIHGITVLQSVRDSNAYYYVPRFPRLVRNADSTWGLLVIKYVGKDERTSGGLFHALISLDLLPEQIDSLARELAHQVPNARLVGPVPLTQPLRNGQEVPNSFQIVSAVLTDTGQGRFTRNVVAAGRALMTSGSQAPIAGLLSPEGATLLWSSFDGPTSDISIALHAQYEAAIQGYRATVTGEMTTMYHHASEILSRQKDYNKSQLRQVVDSLVKRGVLKVDVEDLSAGLTTDKKAMEALLNLITDKLTQVMFDPATGWSKEPDREPAVEADQLKGRQEEGFFAKVFGGGDTKYYTDDQFVLKDITNIQQRSFQLFLNQGGTVTVPIDAAGNLSAFFHGLPDHDRYFRIVNVKDDIAFQRLPVTFQVDLGSVEAFQDLVNFVSVSVRKSYPGKPAFTESFQITPEDIKAGKLSRTIEIPRLGETGADWSGYEYQVRWSLRGNATIPMPAGNDQWIPSSEPAISLLPPFERVVVELDANRADFQTAGFQSASAQFLSVLVGKRQVVRQVTMRAKDTDGTSRVVVYRDPDAPIAYRVQWYNNGGTRDQGLTLLGGTYLFLAPPGVPTVAATPGAPQ